MTALYSYRHGFVTLSLLVLIASSLFIALLFNDDLLRMHSAISSERMRYAQQSLALQELSRQQQDSICTSEPADSKQPIVEISSVDEQAVDSLKHYFWCKQVRLFKTNKLSKNLYEGQLTKLVDLEELAKLYLPVAPPTLTSSATPRLYWVPASQTEIELVGEIEGILLVEKDVLIRATGKKNKFKGVVISNGTVTVEGKGSLAYSRAVWETLFKQYSYWQRAEQSWYDFKPTKN